MLFLELINRNGFSLVIALAALLVFPSIIHLIHTWDRETSPTRFDLIPLLVTLAAMIAFRLMLYANTAGIVDLGPAIASTARVRDITMLVGMLALTRKSSVNLYRKGKSWIVATFRR